MKIKNEPSSKFRRNRPGRRIAALLLIGMSFGFPLSLQAEVLSVSEDEMGGISARGGISIGSYQWTDDHQFDASTNKGALIMNGSAQQYATSETIVNATQSAIATGVTSVGTISSGGNDVITITNTNESTAFVGGF
ncbi:MAG TPA: hypothetical protein VI702_02970 [Nitrospiria bacterium]